jgi:predicted Zn-dependent peptidase
MAGLLWDRRDFEAERSVILEEIAEVEDDPWDALELAVHDAFHGDHPYGRRILGTHLTVAALGVEELAAFHRAAYSPERAVLTIAGAVTPETLDVAEELFGPFEAMSSLASIDPPTRATDLRRVRVRHGETRRGLLALPGPAAAEPDFVHLRLALTALCGGRASRLQRLLVDEGELCQGVSSALTETVRPGAVTLALELLPGVEEHAVERVLWDELARARNRGLDEAAVERGRRLLLSDWLFSHETIELRGAAVGAGLALFGEDYARTQLRLLKTASVAEVGAAARRYLDPERGGVMGWAGP